MYGWSGGPDALHFQSKTKPQQLQQQLQQELLPLQRQLQLLQLLLQLLGLFLTGSVVGIKRHSLMSGALCDIFS